MSLRFISTIILLLTLFLNCKEEEEEEFPADGTGELIKNDTTWNFDVYAGLSGGYYNKYTISFRGNINGRVAWNIGLRNILLEKKLQHNFQSIVVCGSGPLLSQDTNAVCCMYTNVLDDGVDHVILSNFNPLPLPDACQLELISLDTIGQDIMVKGKFFGTFVEDSMFLHSGHLVPDTVRIEDATFECRIERE